MDMKSALIVDGAVREILRALDGFTLQESYHSDILAACVEAPDAVEEGWTYDGSVFAPPPASPPPTKAELIAYAADKRWRVETGGITIAGVPVATDDRSKIMIMGARVAAGADPEWSTVWHGADGETYPLNAASMIGISNAVEAHVNAGFARFAMVKAGIEAGEITTMAQVDNAFA